MNVTQFINNSFAQFGQNIAMDYSRLYGKGFVKTFLNCPSVQSASQYACKWFEWSGVWLEGEQDLKARGIVKPDFEKYVEGIEADLKTKDLLVRTLNMIFILRQ